MIDYDDFLKVDIRVGTIIEAEEFAAARKAAFKLRIDFGGEVGVRKSSAQITSHYKLENLVGRQICAVVNFPPKQIGPFMSEVLVLGFSDSNNEIILIGPDKSVSDGNRLH